MKKYCLLALAALALASPAQARWFDWGIKAGGNYSFYQSGSSVRNKAGLNAGVFADTRMGRRFDFSMEFLYSREGRFFSSGSGQLASNSVHVPLLLRYYPSTSGKVSIDFGGLMGINWMKMDDPGSFFPNDHYGDEHTFTSFALGPLVGVTWNFSQRMLLSARYNLIYMENFDNDRWRTNTLQLSVGYRF